MAWLGKLASTTTDLLEAADRNAQQVLTPTQVKERNEDASVDISSPETNYDAIAPTPLAPERTIEEKNAPDDGEFVDFDAEQEQKKETVAPRLGSSKSKGRRRTGPIRAQSDIDSRDREIAQLNQKLRAAAKRHDDVIAELNRTQRKLADQELQIQAYSSNESQFGSVVSTRDAQIEAMKTQLEESKQAIERLKGSLASVDDDQLNIVQEKEELLSRVEKAEKAQSDTVEELERVKLDSRGRLDELERQNDERAEDLAIAQSDLERKTMESQQASQKARALAGDVKKLRDSLTQYKARAARVLQSKEPDATPSTEAAETLALQLKSVESERDAVRQEAATLQVEIESLKDTISEMEMQSGEDARIVASRIEELDTKLRHEKSNVDVARQELMVKTRELSSMQDSSKQSRNELSSELRAKQIEVAQLRAKVDNQASVETIKEEYEERLRQSAGYLVDKQTQLEIVQSERNALQIQLAAEKSRSQDHESRRRKHVTIDVEEDDSPVHRLPVHAGTTVSRIKAHTQRYITVFLWHARRFVTRYPNLVVALVFALLFTLLIVSFVLGSETPPVIPESE